MARACRHGTGRDKPQITRDHTVVVSFRSLQYAGRLSHELVEWPKRHELVIYLVFVLPNFGLEVLKFTF